MLIKIKSFSLWKCNYKKLNTRKLEVSKRVSVFKGTCAFWIETLSKLYIIIMCRFCAGIFSKDLLI